MLEFYDIRKDPKETSPLPENHALIPEYEALLQKHQGLGEALRSPDLKNSEEKEILKKLKSLGYLR